MIDTHAHIYLPQFSSDLSETIQRAREVGLQFIMMPDIDSSTTQLMREVEKTYPEICRSMIGLHPCSVKENYREELKLVKNELETGEYIAVGEIGTDLYWDKTYWEEQQEALRIQLEWAAERDLPAVLHCRDSIDETIEIVQKVKSEGLRGIFHCFTGSVDQAVKIVDMGFYLGIGGVVTFKNGGLEPVIKNLPLNSLVLETDSPYLAPSPNRGKRNEPSYIHLVAEKIASIKGVEVSEVVDTTTQTAKRIFGL